MDENPAQAQEGRGFRAVLMPHRSLSPRGFLFLMTFIGGVSFVAGMSFLAMGAWPVMGFFGLDALLVYGAFKINYRAARRIEVVEITSEDLKLIRVQPNGQREEIALNPYWARPHLAERPDGANRLYLRSHGRAYAVGSFLTDDERRDLADALGRALADVRGR
ncbi:MAG: DUF2244 domain-containing protein [Hyphomicrobium sp.]|mgnify:FL=1|nr:DUF2244 domain-containing protein [Hyphomicrobium sp.]